MPEFIVKLEGREVERVTIDKPPISIGRGRDNDIHLENLSVSRHHARIEEHEGQYILHDLNSSNGTFINGIRHGSATIFHLDTIAIGKHEIVFVNPASQPAEASADLDQTILIGAPAPGGSLLVAAPRQRARVVPLTTLPVQIGRGDSNEVRVSDWFVDLAQALILKRDAGACILRSISQTTPTLLNGEPVSESPLADADVIQAGQTQFVYFPDVIDELQAQSFTLPALQPVPPQGARTPPAEPDVEPGPVGPAPEPVRIGEEETTGETTLGPDSDFSRDPDAGEELASTHTEGGARAHDDIEEYLESEFAHEIDGGADLAAGPLTDEMVDSEHAGWEGAAGASAVEPAEADFKEESEWQVEDAGEPEEPVAGLASENEDAEDASIDVAEMLQVADADDFETEPGSVQESIEALHEAAAWAGAEDVEEEGAGDSGAEPPVREAGDYSEEQEPAEWGPEVEADAVPAEAAEETFAASEGGDPKLIARLEQALKNPSLAVRKQAALQLKRLTGRDHEY